MIDIKVTKLNNDFSERENSILGVLVMNLISAANAFVVKDQGAMLSPLEKSDGDIYYEQMSWQKSITEEKAIELKKSIEMRIVNAFKMLDIEGTEISLLDNAYLYK